jgi:hypothetical protein
MRYKEWATFMTSPSAKSYPLCFLLCDLLFQVWTNNGFILWSYIYIHTASHEGGSGEMNVVHASCFLRDKGLHPIMTEMSDSVIYFFYFYSHWKRKSEWDVGCENKCD